MSSFHARRKRKYRKKEIDALFFSFTLGYCLLFPKKNLGVIYVHGPKVAVVSTPQRQDYTRIESALPEKGTRDF
jgi:hypothetical protein